MDNDIKNLRTYEEDIKDALDQGGVTTTQIVLAEQKKKQQAKPIQLSPIASEGKSKNVKMIGIILALIIVAGGIFYGVTTYILPMKNKAPVATRPATVDFITVDKNIYIETKGKIFSEVISKAKEELSRNNTYNKDQIAEVNIIKTVSEKDSVGATIEVRKKITPADFFQLVDSRAPENLIRAFGSKILIGGHQREKLEPFIIMKVSDQQQAFAGMIEWEPNLIRDVQDIFMNKLSENQIERPIGSVALPVVAPVVKAPPAPTATTTSNSTASTTQATSSETTSTEIIVPEIPKPTYDTKKFVDVVMLNKDTRAIKNSNNEVIFFYSFIDKENLIMTTNIDTLRKVISGLNTANLIR